MVSTFYLDHLNKKSFIKKKLVFYLNKYHDFSQDQMRKPMESLVDGVKFYFDQFEATEDIFGLIEVLKDLCLERIPPPKGSFSILWRVFRYLDKECPSSKIV